jgi:hypothetical protein
MGYDVSLNERGDGTMASITVGFSIPEEDQPRLDHLVKNFAHGNRSAFLRIAMKHMEVVEQADQLNELADYGSERLAAKGLTVDDIPALVKRVLSPPVQK